jgi:nucleoside-diphosphate-sugar epimerase
MSSFYGGRCVTVTGGLGLIGSCLSEELLSLGARVILVDDESKGSWRYIGHLRDQVEYRKVDLTDPARARDALSDGEYVFHLASRAYGVGFSQSNNFEMFRFNDLVNTNVLDGVATHKPAHVLVVSSSCVYPDDGPTPMSDCLPIAGEPERVNWGYGWAKRVLEQKATIYQKETGIPITVVRPFNIYGENYNWCGESSQAIPMLVKRVMDRENPLVVWGSGNQRRNYIHAIDCARCMLRLVENGYVDRPVNIGREETVSVKDLVRRVASLAETEVNLKFDRSRPEGRFIKSADSRLLMAALGDDFEWRVDLQEGLERMVGWYKETFIDDRSKTWKTKALASSRPS